MSESMEFNIVKEELEGITILKVFGRIDRAVVSEFSNEVKKALKESNYKLVIDMGGVIHINSLGVGVLINSLREARLEGGNLILANLNNTLKRILKIMGLFRLFVYTNSVEEAVKFFDEK